MHALNQWLMGNPHHFLGTGFEITNADLVGIVVVIILLIFLLYRRHKQNNNYY
ncbi:MAG TPA: hypothetical protein H9958_06750 [Candidatus Limosilactobacillus intestinavium]|nr:hypothetical protein [Candidatus Limosilactobacillus intestinavium]